MASKTKGCLQSSLLLEREDHEEGGHSENLKKNNVFLDELGLSEIFRIFEKRYVVT
jgi:hypothetical protein